jgi:hypothetical protein
MKGAATSNVEAASIAASQALNASRLSHGSVADALVAATFALCALDASLFLSSASFLIAGPGVGTSSFDGRAKQPGLGGRRPRGFIASQSPTNAAKIAVPGLPPVLLAMHAGRGNHTLSELAQIGLSSAENFARIDSNRAVLLKAFAKERSMIFAPNHESGLRNSLLLAASPTQGGMLTDSDIDDLRCNVTDANPELRGSLTPDCDAILLDFGRDELDAEADALDRQIVVAVDARGVFGAGIFVRCSDTLDLGVGFSAPLWAVPKLRGVRHIAAGSTLASPSSIALIREGNEVTCALGVAGTAGDKKLASYLRDRSTGPAGVLSITRK